MTIQTAQELGLGRLAGLLSAHSRRAPGRTGRRLAAPKQSSKGLVHGAIIRERPGQIWIENDHVRRLGDAVSVLPACQAAKV
jgi:hypothetical protein